MRNFDTGATRDSVDGKLMFEGFLAPAVLKRYAEYMHEHRLQADGKLRAPDNWQKGIPVPAYRDSLVRHVFDLWFLWRSGKRILRKTYQDLLCAILFNTMGLLFEDLRADPVDQAGSSTL